MSCYEALAGSYDALTEDVGYAKRADFLEKLLRRSRIPVKLVLDLACGTGTMTWLLTARGYEVIGVDGSEDMLAAAMGKGGQAAGVPPVFLHQSMPRLDLYGTVDAAVCCLDSLNYLTDPKDVQRTFRRLHLFVAPGGALVFDVNTAAKLGRWTGRCFWTRRRTPTACGGRSITGGCAPIIWICSAAGRTARGSAAPRCTGSDRTRWSS